MGVSIIQMVGTDVVLVDRFFDQAHTEELCIKIDIPTGMTSHRRKMMKTVQLHRSPHPNHLLVSIVIRPYQSGNLYAMATVANLYRTRKQRLLIIAGDTISLYPMLIFMVS